VAARIFVNDCISKKVGEGFVASCIPSPTCTMGDVNGVSERSQQYGLWEFSQTLSSQYGAGLFSSSMCMLTLFVNDPQYISGLVCKIQQNLHQPFLK